VKLVLGTTVAAIDILAKFSYSKKNPHTSLQNEKNINQKNERTKSLRNLKTDFHFISCSWPIGHNKKPNLNNNTQKRPYPSPKATNKSENGIKRSRPKKNKTKLHRPVDDESTNRERNREEDGFCEAEMRAKLCVRERRWSEHCERATPRS
jgi:hypothetical protein